MPMIVRQKGLIDDTLKVYIESNVINFIKEMKEKTKLGNRYAALVGNVKMIEEEMCLVIDGVVKCNCRNHINLDDYFIKQVRGYIESKVKMYFGDSKIVGLVSINKFDYEEKNECIKGAFEKLFKDEYNLLMMQNKFSEELYFVNNNEINELNGYFIYYEENENMKTYTQDEEIEEINDLIDDNKTQDELNIWKNVKKGKSKVKKEVEKREGTLIPALLFALCIVLGFGLIKNSEDLESVKGMLLNVTEKYESMSKEIEMQNEMIQVVSLDSNKEKTNSISSEKENNTTNDNKKNDDDEIEEESELYTLYEVKSGDSLKSISKALYGDESKANKIKEFNKIDDENLIKVGDLLKIPANN